MEHPKSDFRTGLYNARGVSLLLFELLERTRGLLAFLLRLRFGGGRRLRLPLGLLFGASRFLGGLQRSRLARCGFFGEAFGLLFGTSGFGRLCLRFRLARRGLLRLAFCGGLLCGGCFGFFLRFLLGFPGLLGGGLCGNQPVCRVHR